MDIENCLQCRQQKLEDDLKILKVEYLKNSLVDHSQTTDLIGSHSNVKLSFYVFLQPGLIFHRGNS